jgi:hypothetical protein
MADGDYYMAFEGATTEDFSGDTLTGVFEVLGAGPRPQQVEGSRKKWGSRAQNTTLYIALIDISGEIAPISEFGTIIELTNIVYSPYFRILAEGTDLPARLYDSVDSKNFWTDEDVGWVRSNRNVVREDFVVSHDFPSGADSWVLTLRAVDPNTFV